ncbi:SCO family protein [Sulfurivermis fontis]|uniref:SCO family protein n=1 Tax=Sulfurivermis fontis TaxID=1972068 RepID=UPI000FD9BFCF|nr:SCO family protein [Sulfurivermis fontis]
MTRTLLLLALLLPALLSAAENESPINGRFMLMNHYGEMVTDRDFGNRYQLIYFGYTFCPDVCPSSLMVITQALKLLGDDAARIQPLFISVDPERDTPQVLREYVSYFHPSIIGLTGSPELIARTAQNFRVSYEKVLVPGMPPDQYQMDHSAGVFLLAPDGRLLVKFAHGILAKDMAARIKDFL